MQISTILDQIDLGAMALPEFQRGYVWNRDQVRHFMLSLYRRHPVGALLVWSTKTNQTSARGDKALAEGSVELILDGQQRATSLYGIIRGEPPPFFDGNANAFTDLYFHVGNESFEFYGPIKMKDNPYWINVTRLMQEGLDPYINIFSQHPELSSHLGTYINRLNRLQGIKDIVIHIEKVTGADKTVDVVVDIFNLVNSGGTKLSKGDLALARVCAEWPPARQELRATLDKWEQNGFKFDMEWLLRNITTLATGDAIFASLRDVSAQDFENAFHDAVKTVNYLLNIVSGRLGLDHNRVLGGRYAFPIMTRYIHQNGGKLKNAQERDKLLYWYVHAMLWGRFSGTTETVLNQDLAAIAHPENGLDRLIEQLRVWRGDLVIRPENFATWSRGARFYPMLYMLTRVGEALDWGTGLPLKANLLGKVNSLQIHHIFPKSQLYKHDHERSKVNALGNYCFLTQAANLQISATLPEVYFSEIEERFPGALASQWIPMDPNLWRVENYLDFLAARQALLSQAANDFLRSLIELPPAQQPGDTQEAALDDPGLDAILEGEWSRSIEVDPSEDNEEILLELNQWVGQLSLPEGELFYELTDPHTGIAQAVLDLAWPQGFQPGLSAPVAFLALENREAVEPAVHAGYRIFHHAPLFRDYVEQEILALESEAV